MAKESVYQYPSMDSFKFSGIVPGAREPPHRVMITYNDLVWSGTVESGCVHIDAGYGKEIIYFDDRASELKNQQGRLYFLCPYCGNRVRKLYLYRGSFQCRQCAGLVYPSQYWDSFERARRKMIALYKKIDPDGDYTAANVLEKKETPPCPEGMGFGEYIKTLFEITKLHEKCTACIKAIFQALEP